MANRQQRRQQARELQKGNVKVLDHIKHEVTQEAITYAAGIFMAAATIALHDEFGFGKQRMERFCRKFELQTTCLASGHVTLAEMQQAVKDMGLDVFSKEGDQDE